VVAYQELRYRTYEGGHGEAVAKREYPKHHKLRGIVFLDL